MMKTYWLERTQLIPRSLEDTFAFFSDALFIKRCLHVIFDYRAKMTAQLLGADDNVEEQRSGIVSANLNGTVYAADFMRRPLT